METASFSLVKMLEVADRAHIKVTAKCVLCCTLSHRERPPDAAVLPEHSSPAVSRTGEEGGQTISQI